MKKIIALLLITVTLLLLASCADNGDKKTTTTTTTTTNTTTTTTTTTGGDDPVINPTEDFTEKKETVYVTTASLNIRKEPNADDETNIFKSVAENTALDRIAYNDTWSKILIDGVEYYASSKYLTTQKPIEFETVDETVYIVGIESINIRSKTSFTSEIVTALSKGESLKRVGVAKEADLEGVLWSKVEVTLKQAGEDVVKTGYINSKYVNTDKDAVVDDNTDPTIDLTPYKFKDVNDKIVVNAETLNLRTAPTFDDSSLSGKAAKKDEVLDRVAVAEVVVDDVIWSKVKVGDEFYYVSPGVEGKYFSVVTEATE